MCRLPRCRPRLACWRFDSTNCQYRPLETRSGRVRRDRHPAERHPIVEAPVLATPPAPSPGPGTCSPGGRATASARMTAALGHRFTIAAAGVLHTHWVRRIMMAETVGPGSRRNRRGDQPNHGEHERSSDRPSRGPWSSGSRSVRISCHRTTRRPTGRLRPVSGPIRRRD